MKRRASKALHENSVLHSFKKMLAMQGHSFKIVDKPDPPDAIVELDGIKSWVEITDAMFNKEYAKSIRAPHNLGPNRDARGQEILEATDPTFEETVVNVVNKKYAKETIKNVYRKKGAGILLVGLFSPFVDLDVINNLSKLVCEIVKSNDPRFNCIYFYDRAHNFYKVEI